MSASAEVTPIKRCRVCNSDARDAPPKGPYANLCASCRSDRGKELGAKRQRDNRERTPEARNLDDAMAKLRAAGRRLEKAVEVERAVKQERHLAISEFNKAIREVNAQAHRVLNSSVTTAARVEERMERELHEIEQDGDRVVPE